MSAKKTTFKLTATESKEVEVEVSSYHLIKLLESGKIPFYDMYRALLASFVAQAGEEDSSYINSAGKWEGMFHDYRRGGCGRDATEAEKEMYAAIEELRMVAFKHKLMGEDAPRL